MEEAKNPLKRIKFKEEEKEEEDRISSLPDCLIVEILSRLPSIEYAIRTGTLSKRWQHLWNSGHTLVLLNLDDDKPLSDFFSFVDKTLSQCSQQLNLNKFTMYTRVYPINDNPFRSQVCNWIRYAINRNVKNLNLTLLLYWNMDYGANFVLDRLIFNISSVTDLKLSGCVFNPAGAISWINLKSLSISKGKLDEVLIANILSGSPLLETLKLHNCYGYSLLDVTSKSIKNLVLSGYDDLQDIIEINAPSILSLTIQGSLWLQKLLLLNLSSLVEANLDYTKFGGYDKARKEEAETEMLKGFLLSLCHVKELKFGRLCFEVFSRLEANGFISPLNLKYLHVSSSSCSDDGPKGDEVNQ